MPKAWMLIIKYAVIFAFFVIEELSKEFDICMQFQAVLVFSTQMIKFADGIEQNKMKHCSFLRKKKQSLTHDLLYKPNVNAF